MGSASRLVMVQSRKAVAAGEGDKESDLERIGKYVPAEILTFFTLWCEGVALATPKPDGAHPFGGPFPFVLAGGLLGLIATPLYFAKAFAKADSKARRYHMVVSTIAFGTYGYSLSTVALGDLVRPGIAMMLTALTVLVAFMAKPVED